MRTLWRAAIIGYVLMWFLTGNAGVFLTGLHFIGSMLVLGAEVLLKNRIKEWWQNRQLRKWSTPASDQEQKEVFQKETEHVPYKKVKIIPSRGESTHVIRTRWEGDPMVLVFECVRLNDRDRKISSLTREEILAVREKMRANDDAKSEKILIKVMEVLLPEWWLSEHRKIRRTKTLAMLWTVDRKRPQNFKIRTGQLTGKKGSELNEGEMILLMRNLSNEGDDEALQFVGKYHAQHDKKTTSGDGTDANMSRSRAAAILGVDEDAKNEVIRKRYKIMAHKVHPDHGGSNEAAKMVNRARDIMMEEKR